MRVSEPASFCSSPSASIMARRALDRAVANVASWLEALREMLERVSRPTAMTVSKIINDRVTISANPFFKVWTFCN